MVVLLLVRSLKHVEGVEPGSQPGEMQLVVWRA